MNLDMSTSIAARRLGIAPAAVLAFAAAAGCVSRADFTVPPAPTPIHFEADELPPPRLDEPLTARDVVALVHERNPSLARARTAVEAALGGLDAAESALLPRLSVSASYVRGDAPSTYLFTRIDSHTLPRVVDFNDPGHLQNVDAALAVRWNVWDGGRARLASWAADVDVDVARRQAESAANALSAAALTAYLDARAAGELLAADDASVKSVEAQVGETRTKVEGGGALRSDLLSLEVRLAEARERRIRSGVAQRLALSALRSLLALPAGADVRLAAERFDPGVLPASVPEAVAEAFRSRPDVSAARRSVEAARMRLEAASRGNLPRLDVEGRTWSDTGDGSVDLANPNWTVALALTFDLFDGGADDAMVRRARAALRAVEEGDRGKLLAVQSEVETAYLRLEEARARVDVTSTAVAASEESLALVETQFKGGAVTVTRFLEAEGARLNARTADVGARLALERALVDVSHALGRFSAATRKEQLR